MAAPEVKLDRNRALDILTRLENGLPPEPGDVPHIRVGREEEVQKICENRIEGLPSVEHGNGDLFFVLGDFGYGKSFFMNLVAERASNRNFIRAEFDIQDIEDIADRGELYTGIVSNIRYPDQKGSGIVPLLRQFCEEVDQTEFDAIATRRGMVGHPIYTMLTNLLEAWNRGQYYVERDETTLQAREVLAGTAGYLTDGAIGLPEKHAIGKKGVGTITGKEEGKLYEYLKHIRSLALELGYDGFVILIDEAAEQLEWSEDTETTQRLIDLFNRCFKNEEFEHMMFVFVGNEEKWDSLIDMTGHQALSDRYHAKKVVLGELDHENYVNLIQKVARIIEIGKDISLTFTAADAKTVVDDAAEVHGGVEALSPRNLLVFPEGRGGRKLIGLLEDEYH